MIGHRVEDRAGDKGRNSEVTTNIQKDRHQVVRSAIIKLRLTLDLARW